MAAANPLTADSSNLSRKQDCEENELGRRYQKLPAPSQFTTDKSIVHTRIGGRDFYVPRNYFRHPQIGCGVEEKGMLLRVLLPDFKPYSEITAAEYRAQRGIGRRMSILFSRTRPLDELVKLNLNGKVAAPPSKTTHGLFHGRHKHGDDLYFSGSSTLVDRYIRCSPVKPNRGSICNHYFEFQGHDVKLGYGRLYLTNWRILQESAERLLSGFTKPPQN